MHLESCYVHCVIFTVACRPLLKAQFSHRQCCRNSWLVCVFCYEAWALLFRLSSYMDLESQPVMQGKPCNPIFSSGRWWLLTIYKTLTKVHWFLNQIWHYHWFKILVWNKKISKLSLLYLNVYISGTWSDCGHL